MYPQFQSREMERSETTSVAVREEEGCSLSFSVGSWRGGKQPQLQSGETRDAASVSVQGDREVGNNLSCSQGRE